VTCDRCGKTGCIYTCSYFNYDDICRDCREKERAHPKYQEAHDAEVEAVMGGDYNYAGIGRPEDL